MEAALAPFHDIRGGWEELVIEKGKGVLRIEREQHLESLTDLGETLHPLTLGSQLGERGFGPTAALKEPMGFVHELAQDTAVAEGRGHAAEGRCFTGGQMALDKGIPMTPAAASAPAPDLCSNLSSVEDQSSVFSW